MAANRNRRLQKEIRDIQQDEHAGISVEVLDEADLVNLRGHFKGPPDTPYDGGMFDVKITIPAEYPFRPPVMKFETKIWHPNISSQTGAICLDTLSSAWSPILTLKSALISLQSLLASPEPKDPQDAEVATMLMRDPDGFALKARQWATKYAGAPNVDSGKDNRAAGTAVATSQKNVEEAQRKAQLKGYPPALVDQFVNLGVDIPTVVAAIQDVGISPSQAQYYVSNDDFIDAVTSRLFDRA